MNQVATRDRQSEAAGSIPLIDILCHDCFKEGFLDVAAGRAGGHEFYNNARDLWFYVRGRLVATEALNTFRRVPLLWIETDAGSVINPLIISLAGAMFFTGAFA